MLWDYSAENEHMRSWKGERTNLQGSVMLLSRPRVSGSLEQLLNLGRGEDVGQGKDGVKVAVVQVDQDTYTTSTGNASHAAVEKR
eukprot:4201923-Pleurochrysis_carterae.AAC.1